MKPVPAMNFLARGRRHVAGLTGLIAGVRATVLADRPLHDQLVTRSTRAGEPKLVAACTGIRSCELGLATNRMRLTMTEGLVLTIVRLPRKPTSAHRIVCALARSALANLTRNEAREWAPHGIQINAIAPAAMSTVAPFGALTGEPDMASLALHLSSEEGRDLTGLMFQCYGE